MSTGSYRQVCKVVNSVTLSMIYLPWCKYSNEWFYYLVLWRPVVCSKHSVLIKHDQYLFFFYSKLLRCTAHVIRSWQLLKKEVLQSERRELLFTIIDGDYVPLTTACILVHTSTVSYRQKSPRHDMDTYNRKIDLHSNLILKHLYTINM